jgi:uncharacterized membrane protein SpoIIM required for sporulation
MRYLFIVAVFAVGFVFASLLTNNESSVNAEMVELQEANRAWATAYAELEGVLETQCVKP